MLVAKGMNLCFSNILMAFVRAPEDALCDSKYVKHFHLPYVRIEGIL